MCDQIYSRQRFLGIDSEKIFSNATVAFLGLGGGGSHIVQQLAHIGIGNYRLFDPQFFESANHNRTVGSYKSDIGVVSKVEIAKRLILKINPDANVEIFMCNWQLADDSLKDVDLISSNLDTFKDRDEAESFARRYLIPYIDIGMDVHFVGHKHVISGQVITSLPGKPCMRCMGFITNKRLEQEAKKYGEAGPNAQVIWPNSSLASVAVGNMVKLLSPWFDEELFSLYMDYDGNNQTMQPSNLYQTVKDKRCPHFNGQHSLGNPFYQPFAKNELK